MSARDPRQYSRITVDLPHNRKLKGATPQAKWLSVVAILWATQNLKDGEVEPAFDIPGLTRDGQGALDETGEDDPASRLRRLIAQRQTESIEILRNWMEHEEEPA